MSPSPNIGGTCPACPIWIDAPVSLCGLEVSLCGSGVLLFMGIDASLLSLTARYNVNVATVLQFLPRARSLLPRLSHILPT